MRSHASEPKTYFPSASNRLNILTELCPIWKSWFGRDRCATFHVERGGLHITGYTEINVASDKGTEPGCTALPWHAGGMILVVSKVDAFKGDGPDHSGMFRG